MRGELRIVSRAIWLSKESYILSIRLKALSKFIFSILTGVKLPADPTLSFPEHSPSAQLFFHTSLTDSLHLGFHLFDVLDIREDVSPRQRQILLRLQLCLLLRLSIYVEGPRLNLPFHLGFHPLFTESLVGGGDLHLTPTVWTCSLYGHVSLVVPGMPTVVTL